MAVSSVGSTLILAASGESVHSARNAILGISL
jgi:hypothetical protein